jgi:glycine betaine/proline transport system substrate-binding protein
VPQGYLERCSNVGKLLQNLQFSVPMESELMQMALERDDPQTVAKQWIKDNPDALDQWLAGVTTRDGQDGVAAVKKFVGL